MGQVVTMEELIQELKNTVIGEITAVGSLTSMADVTAIAANLTIDVHIVGPGTMD